MEPFIGQIMMVGFSFAPRGWALCNGQLLDIASNAALFSLIGTFYGGDGRTTFGLPDLRGRVPIHFGQGPGLPNFVQGSKAGTTTNVLTVQNLPPHGHTVAVPAKEEADTEIPTGHYVAGAGFNGFGTTTDINMASFNTGNVGNSQAVNNLQPYLTINFIIALTGLFPSRS